MIFHVVDDQPVICEFVGSVMYARGHEARFFLSSVEYLDYLTDRTYARPDAIFTDMGMPLVSGQEIVRRVMNVYPDQKFVVISGAYMPEQKCGNGICYFLNKPFGSDELEQVIAMLEDKKI